MRLSVVVPLYNEEKYISDCMESLLIQDFPKEEMEVLMVDGMSTDRTCEIVRSYVSQYRYIRLLVNPQRTVPCAMNIGITEAKGDVIVRLDAHAKYDSNYLSTMVRKLNDLNADNVGSVCRTDVFSKTDVSLAICCVLSDKFGVGNSHFRLGGLQEPEEVDTVPFGCWRKTVFERFGKFDERLDRNQDIELNKRIKRQGGRIFLLPNPLCTYYARETYGELAKNNFMNGKWNILTVYYTKDLNSLSLRHFVPLLFVLSLVLPVLCLPLCSFLWVPTAFVALLYCLVISVYSLQLSFKNRLCFSCLFFVFLTLHFSYGIGSLCGIGSVLKKVI